MTGRLLARGLIAGLVAACLAFLFGRLFGEPSIAHAISFEEARDALAGEPPEPELVSRTVQSTWGLLTAIVMLGAAYGGLFALGFSLAYGRIARLTPRATALLVAAIGFVVLVLVPDLKYPPNPPAVGNPETIGLRTEVYFEMILISVCCAVIACLASRPLIQKLGTWNGTIVAGVLFIALVSGMQFTLPDISEMPDSFPATVLWRFREAAIGTQMVLWSAMALIFGPMAEKVLRAPQRSSSHARTLG